MIKNGSIDLILNTIFTLGPRKLFEMLPANIRNKEILKLYDKSKCSVCRAITDNPYIVNMLYSLLEPLRWKIFSLSAVAQYPIDEDFSL